MRFLLALGVAVVVAAPAPAAMAEFETAAVLRGATILIPPNPFGTCVVEKIQPAAASCDQPGD